MAGQRARPCFRAQGQDPGLGQNQYFKFGPYRAPHAAEWTLYYDDFRRSPNCADVLAAAGCPAE